MKDMTSTLIDQYVTAQTSLDNAIRTGNTVMAAQAARILARIEARMN